VQTLSSIQSVLERQQSIQKKLILLGLPKVKESSTL